jgi:methyl-accepting chemotaxis protein
MANGLIVFPADGSAPVITPWADKDKLVHARTLYEAAADKGLITGQVDWVAIYGAKGVRWKFGEEPDSHNEISQELIANGAVTQEAVSTYTQEDAAPLANANAIAAADLTGGKLQATTNDEFAELTDAINQMQQNLANLLEDINEKASSVAGATEQISAASIAISARRKRTAGSDQSSCKCHAGDGFLRV